MQQIFRTAKRFVSIVLIAGFCMVSLSACATNETQVGNWWYDQQWEAADAS